ncbi:HAD-IIB family hydrolase [Ramlibacter henchirensis]|uniref:HAD-IIB family hydrolase n=1 Tax=Ramlibacter henchirensis TaxID=204072 RepID=A0A4Z0C9L9_9BURK|nr:HAD-IIB family hydrolase [Ramlibacter henchirensis]TFZ07572.1 HAD-IIB family hydrolase [Ramlibacter henchirensis]
MPPLSSWPEAARRGVLGVFTDIDDTLTTEGAITADALAALGGLKAAGLHVIPITGRPVGWSEPFAQAWPVDAIVAENGAVALVREPGGRLRKFYQQAPAEREENFARMQRVLARIEREVPGARRAQDSGGRETDIAIDHSEFTRLPQERIDEVVALMRSEGMNATVSSIHINGWWGAHHKLSGARWIARTLLDADLDAQIGRWVYVGDSTNDVMMFEHFPHSVGVANIRRFAAQLSHPPAYVTQGERGAGFAEVARAILQAR